MRTICFYFQVHQPPRLKRYRFFDIGQDDNYFSEFENRAIMKKVARKCYLPTNRVLLDLINEFSGSFKVAFSISGTAMDQFELYAPEVLSSFQELVATGCVEILSETYGHSLASLINKKEFSAQIEQHKKKIKHLFNVEPEVFRNTELIYSNEIGNHIADMGYKGMLAEGAKHIMGWKSPNYLYCSATNPKLKLLLKNFRLSDDIAFRFSNREWNQFPLTAEKYVDWLNSVPPEEEMINLFMDYETFGEHQWEETGIFAFLQALPRMVFNNSDYSFSTPSEIIANTSPIATIDVPQPISWADEERDLSAWLGNELQDEAFKHLYQLYDRVQETDSAKIKRDWLYLQTSDHFYYMCTKWFSDGDVHKYFNPYESPYEAFINFMNVLSDFIIRLDRCKKE